MRQAAIAIFWLAAVAVPAAGVAGMPATAGGADGGEVGKDTRTWLELQRSGRSAAPDRPMSGAVASRVYKRYLDSFTHPLPDFYEEKSLSGGASR